MLLYAVHCESYWTQFTTIQVVISMCFFLIISICLRLSWNVEPFMCRTYCKWTRTNDSTFETRLINVDWSQMFYVQFPSIRVKLGVAISLFLFCFRWFICRCIAIPGDFSCQWYVKKIINKMKKLLRIRTEFIKNK